MILKDRVAVVTGAGRGLGAAIARELARQGAIVCVNYFRSRDAAAKVVADIAHAGGQAFTWGADVTSESEVRALMQAVIDRYGRIDAIVNNALPSYAFDPSARYTRIETAEWEDFQRQYEGAVRATYNTTRAALPFLRDAGYGKIVNIATNLIYNPVVPYHDYTSAKAGLLGLTRTLAAELGPAGIRVNLVAGGLLRTTDASKVTTDAVFDYVAGASPLRRVVTPEEFARVVSFFVSPWSDAVTGQSIAVDAGLTMA